MSKKQNNSGITLTTAHTSLSNHTHASPIKFVNGSNSIHLDQHLSTDKISKLIRILCDGDIDKIKKVIEADIDRELSGHLLTAYQFETDYLLHIFSVFLKTFEGSSGSSSDLDIFSIILEKVPRKSFYATAFTVLEASLIKVKYPTVYFDIKRKIQDLQDSIPNSVEYIGDEND